MMIEWHKADIAEVVLELGTDVKVGRTNLDSNRKRNGENKVFHVPAVDSKRIVRQIASDASLVLLAVTYVIAAILGFFTEAMVAIPILLSVFALSYYISFVSEKRIAESYRVLLPKAKIIENGKRIRLSASDVEVGDLIYFSKGDIIPADARLVSSNELYLAERFYNEYNGKTEFKRFKKDHEVIYTDDVAHSSYENMVYASSMVVSGRGSAIVTAIGTETRVGKIHRGLSPVPENDRPDYLDSFSRFTKRFSLLVLFSLIPVSLGLIYISSLNGSSGEHNNILYIFLTMLAVSVTSMSELISSPAAAIVSHTLFKSKRRRNSEITKLSSAETLAETDTVLILCPDVLKDKRRLVRRVFFSEKEYRFDLLKSNELNSFSETVSSFYKFQRTGLDDFEIRAIKRFVANRASSIGEDRSVRNPKILRNFPIDGAVSCVYATNDDYPVNYVSKSSELSILTNCEYFRTDGGSKWRFSDESRDKVFECYQEYLELGLNVYIFISKSEEDECQVFEGMLAIGEEYPFSDGEVFSGYSENNIRAILIFETESSEAVKFALNCGIADSLEDIVLASELERAGVLLSDIRIDSSVYIGFGREGTYEIVKYLSSHARSVLPIIKDSSDRSAISPLTVYATHAETSFDSIKIASSLPLLPPDSEDRSGGVADALHCINNSRLARLKLECFKRYLSFATLSRISLTVFSLLAERTIKPMSALMILLSGLLCDLAAMLVIATAKGTPSASHADDKKRRFALSLPPAIIYSAGGILVSLCSFIAVNLLFEANAVSSSNAQIFTFYSSVIIQIFAQAAVLLSIGKRTVTFKFNTAFVSLFTAFLAYLLLQTRFPVELFRELSALSYSQVELSVLPLLLIPGIISLVTVMLIDKLFSIFSNK